MRQLARNPKAEAEATVFRRRCSTSIFWFALIAIFVPVCSIPRGVTAQSQYDHNHNGGKRLTPRNSVHATKVPVPVRGGARKPRLPFSRHANTGAAVKVKSSKGTQSTVSKSKNDINTSTSWFPILRSELPQFASMSFMMFLFIYVFTTVRDTKDTLVVSNCGAEAIPFLKLYGVMPCAMLFIIGYSKLSNALSSKAALFYATLIPFFVFYAVFAFVLYPMRDSIHVLVPSTSSASGARNAAMSLVHYWSFSLFFIVSELWASAGVPLLFWQCANDVTGLSEAKRFYPLFAVTGNLAPIASGKIMSMLVSRQRSADDAGFGDTLKVLATIKVLICLSICLLYRAVNAMAAAKAVAEAKDTGRGRGRRVGKSAQAAPKKKATLKESVVELSKSRELRSMAAMVICYNVCIELTEVLWKGILRKSYTNKSAYMAFMARFSQTVGVMALVLQLCASGIIRRLGWKWAALLTPIAMGMLAVPFFASVAAGPQKVALATALLIGTAQNVVSKITKYSLFDPCKEMAFIPLGPEAKVKGKAAVDVLGARLGRSIGSASQQLLVVLAGGSIIKCAPALGVFYAITIYVWSGAVVELSSLFESKDEPVKKRKKSAERGQKTRTR